MSAPLPPEVPAGAPTIGGGRYVVVGRLGEGGMAGVFRAYDRRLRVWRAVKVLYPQFAMRASVRQRFEAEAHAMARLEHENLVRMYDVEDGAALPFLVMELVDGGTLHDWVRQYGPMAPRLACGVILQVATGAWAAHHAGIIHRDIKPQNVLISSQGVCKLTDFGVALHTDNGLTRPGVALGTAGYMAPEQRTDARNVDARADLYGLGATLWTLLTGELAHDLHHMSTKPRLLAQIPPGLQPVIRTSCAFDPGERFPDVRRFHEALVEAAKLLPPDPSDRVLLTAALHRDPEDEASPDFPEIAPVLEWEEPQPGAKAEGAGRDTPSLLPYSMPDVEGKATPIRFWDRTEDVVPDYVDREAMARTPTDARRALARSPAPVAAGAALPPAEETIGVEGPTARATPARRTPSPKRRKPVRPPAERASPVRRRQLNTVRMVLVAVGAGSLLALLFVLVLAMGGAQLGAARRATLESRARIYDALRDFGARIPEFEPEDQPRVHDAYMRYLEQSGEPGRIAAALFCLSEIEASTPPTVAGEQPSSTLQTVRRLGSLRRDYEQDRALWIQRSAGFPGSLLVSTGMAQAPPSGP